MCKSRLLLARLPVIRVHACATGDTCVYQCLCPCHHNRLCSDHVRPSSVHNAHVCLCHIDLLLTGGWSRNLKFLTESHHQRVHAQTKIMQHTAAILPRCNIAVRESCHSCPEQVCTDKWHCVADGPVCACARPDMLPACTPLCLPSTTSHLPDSAIPFCRSSLAA